MVNLALLYEEGDGVQENLERALKLYERASELGDSDALNNFGLMYEEGRGVEMDIHKAIEYYEKAVEQNNAESMLNLGAIYEEGRGGVKVDLHKGFNYFYFFFFNLFILKKN